jgi:hypothetical protein
VNSDDESFGRDPMNLGSTGTIQTRSVGILLPKAIQGCSARSPFGKQVANESHALILPEGERSG